MKIIGNGDFKDATDRQRSLEYVADLRLRRLVRDRLRHHRAGRRGDYADRRDPGLTLVSAPPAGS
jgi:hypothetical protein